mmetsp:Transcript_7319/g.16021  ORF Transcript_7319/g.16021 Transcript_7319/m.16021 type:complete len:203 (+) Transcript_7319:737-1345(+)
MLRYERRHPHGRVQSGLRVPPPHRPGRAQLLSQHLRRRLHTLAGSGQRRARHARGRHHLRALPRPARVQRRRPRCADRLFEDRGHAPGLDGDGRGHHSGADRGREAWLQRDQYVLRGGLHGQQRRPLRQAGRAGGVQTRHSVCRVGGQQRPRHLHNGGSVRHEQLHAVSGGYGHLQPDETRLQHAGGDPAHQLHLVQRGPHH